MHAATTAAVSAVSVLESQDPVSLFDKRRAASPVLLFDATKIMVGFTTTIIPRGDSKKIKCVVFVEMYSDVAQPNMALAVHG